MTQSELEQLDLDVAEKYGIEPFFYTETNPTQENPCGDTLQLWLHDDIGRCAALAVENEVWFEPYLSKLGVKSFCRNIEAFRSVANEDYANHNGNKIRATCVAILKALLAKDKP